MVVGPGVWQAEWYQASPLFADALRGKGWPWLGNVLVLITGGAALAVAAMVATVLYQTRRSAL